MNITEHYRERVFYVFSVIGIVSTLVFGILLYIIQGKYGYAVFELLLVIAAFFNVLYYRKTKNYDLASKVVLSLMVIILSFLITTGGYRGTGIMWVYTYPLLTFFLRDRKGAFLWNTLLGLAVVSLILLEFSGHLEVYYDVDQLRQAAGSYTAVFLLTFFYNKILEEALHRLHERSIVDSLTGLYNRAFFIESLSKLTERLKREAISAHCIVYLDLDRFKSVNDTYGHEVGDLVLQKVAKIIRAGFRRSDIVSRIGGDEFIVLAYDSRSEDIKKKVDKVVMKIEEAFKEYGLSASYGIVDIPKDSLDVKEILKLADERMYKMKLSKRKSAS